MPLPEIVNDLAARPSLGVSRTSRAFSLNRALVYRERLRARPTVVLSLVRGRVRRPLAFCAAEQVSLLATSQEEPLSEPIVARLASPCMPFHSAYTELYGSV
jgi:hypothetical protein